MMFLVAWWHARQPRERVLLFCLMALLSAGLLHLGWQRAVAFKVNAEQDLRREHQALQILPELERALQQRRASGSAHKNLPDIETINNLAKQSGLILHLIPQEGGWSLSETVRVDFSQLVAFLARLESRYGLTAETLQLERERQYVRLTSMEIKHVK